MLIDQELERGLVRRAIAPEAVPTGTSGGTSSGTSSGPAAPAEVAAGAVGLDDLGGRVAQRGADVVNLDLIDGALLAFPGLIGPLAQPAVDDHPHAPLQALGGVLRRLP